MGRKSRTKRERRKHMGFAASLTACEGTWLERLPDDAEKERLKAAREELEKHRSMSIGEDQDKTNRASLQVYRDERFAILHFDDWIIEGILERFGEPPIVENDSDPAFSNYLRQSIRAIASSQTRRAIAQQSQRFVPAYVESGQIKEALIIEYNAFMTVMSDAITPLLVQMMVGGLARWYDEHEEDEEENSTTTTLDSPE
ncbi:MAG: hypothetical protein AAGF95_11430 [Chloroflexota bacterium]